MDKLKCLYAFLIVCIHAPFPGEVRKYFEALTRIAVPIFFMISGYFFYLPKDRKQIKKLFILFLMGNIVFFIWNASLAIVKGEFLPLVFSLFTARNLFKLIILNDSFIYGHLWYLGAILYVVVIVSIVFKWDEKKGRKVLYIITTFLLLGDLMLGKYSLILFHQEFPYTFVRNWIFVGGPYFSIGMWVR